MKNRAAGSHFPHLDGDPVQRALSRQQEPVLSACSRKSFSLPVAQEELFRSVLIVFVKACGVASFVPAAPEIPIERAELPMTCPETLLEEAPTNANVRNVALFVRVGSLTPRCGRWRDSLPGPKRKSSGRCREAEVRSIHAGQCGTTGTCVPSASDQLIEA